MTHQAIAFSSQCRISYQIEAPLACVHRPSAQVAAVMTRQLTPQLEPQTATPDSPAKKTERSLASYLFPCATRVKKAYRRLCQCPERNASPSSSHKEPTDEIHLPLSTYEKAQNWAKSPLKDPRLLDKDTIELIVGQNKPSDLYHINTILQIPQNRATFASLSFSSQETLRKSPSELDDGPLLKYLKSQQRIKTPEDESPIFF